MATITRLDTDQTATSHRPVERLDTDWTVAVPLAAAAARLGVSVEAVRQRIRRGTLAGEKRAGRWVALLPAEPVTGQRRDTPEQLSSWQLDAPEQATRQQPDTGERPALLAHVLAENAYLRQALEREQRASAELRRLLAAEQQRRLPAPVDTAATHAETAENPPAPADPTLRVSTPWWAFWRR